MPKSCPECGAAVEFTSQKTEVLQGECTACHHAYVLLPVESPIEHLGAAEGAKEAEEAAEELDEEEEESLLPCPTCGEGLELETAGPDRLTATCGSCGAVVRFRRESEEAEGEEPMARPMRGPSRRGDAGAEPPRARPCRQCGAPLRFETNADQTVTGRCESCGNEFTLPPRREGGGARFGRGGGGGYSRFPRGGGRFGKPRFGGRSEGPRRGGRFRGSRDDDHEGTERRRRRRE